MAMAARSTRKNRTEGEKGDGTQGERSCPPGYVVLDKPNRYGAFCEPKEGLPETPEEKLACQFPGQVGDDCHCPPGTEFAGYKGCIVVRMKYCRKRNINRARHLKTLCASLN